MRHRRQSRRCSSRQIVHRVSVADASDHFGLGGDMSGRTGCTFTRRCISEQVETHSGLLSTNTILISAYPTEDHICAGFEEHMRGHRGH